MKTFITTRILPALLVAVLPSLAQADPLPSWNAGHNKSAIVDFVEAVSDPSSDDFVPQQQRIAVFDNDGTLWGEQPAYFQLMYALDRASEAEPEQLTSELHQAAAEGDIETVLEAGEEGIQALLSLSHQDVSLDEFEEDVSDWLANATHPDTGRFYTDMIYQPMLELLSYLRDSGFSTYIVSGGGLHFIRTFAEDVYGVPPQNVIGSTGGLEVKDLDSDPSLYKQEGDTWINDGPLKIVSIERHIGQRPIMAVGNSDGDVPMLIWTTQGDGPRLGVLVHHTDAEREVAYDRDSHIGRLADGLDQAEDRGWQLIDMASDWQRVYPQAP
ncbi:haloacid dehalogenase-like hydrolase [Halomonas denitrificans]|uniref:HAD family hydrolase n=1 Tax=Halomonas denitrificans TaxID=370769 RepID=UPI001CD5309D|nr:HAD family hydrolase [Halomonas denitrificans]MCA0975264.1 haloacid dehalogenase-like hydrolase [Halomonas denitrificans]